MQSRRASYFSRSSKQSDLDGTSLRRKSTNPARVQEDADDEGDVANGKYPGFKLRILLMLILCSGNIKTNDSRQEQCKACEWRDDQWSAPRTNNHSGWNA